MKNETCEELNNSNEIKETPIGRIPVITITRIQPANIDASSTIKGGFGSNEREVIARAIVLFYQEKGGWDWIITADDIKTELLKLGEHGKAHPLYNLESRCGYDGSTCPGVGDVLLLQKVAKNTYVVTDLFVATCYEASPKT